MSKEKVWLITGAGRGLGVEITKAAGNLKEAERKVNEWLKKIQIVKQKS